MFVSPMINTGEKTHPANITASSSLNSFSNIYGFINNLVGLWFDKLVFYLIVTSTGTWN